MIFDIVQIILIGFLLVVVIILTVFLCHKLNNEKRIRITEIWLTILLALVLFVVASADVWLYQIFQLPTPWGPIVFKQLSKGHETSISQLWIEKKINLFYGINSTVDFLPQLKKDIVFSYILKDDTLLQNQCLFLEVYGVPDEAILNELELPGSISKVGPDIRQICLIDNEVDMYNENSFIKKIIEDTECDSDDILKCGSYASTYSRLEGPLSFRQRKKIVGELITDLEELDGEYEDKLSSTPFYYSVLGVMNFHLAQFDVFNSIYQQRGIDYIDEGLSLFPNDLNLLFLRGLYYMMYDLNWHDASRNFLNAGYIARENQKLIIEIGEELKKEEELWERDWRTVLKDRYERANLLFRDLATYSAAVDGSLDHLPGTDPVAYAESVFQDGKRLNPDREYYYEARYGLVLAVAAGKAQCPKRKEKLNSAIEMLGHALEEARLKKDRDQVLEINENLQFTLDLKCHMGS